MGMDDLSGIEERLEALRREAEDYRDIMQDNAAFMESIMMDRTKGMDKEIADRQRVIRSLQDEMQALRDRRRVGEQIDEEEFAAIRQKIELENQEINTINAKKAAQEKMNGVIKKTMAETMQLTEVYGKHEIINVDLIARVGQLAKSFRETGNAGAIIAAGIGGLANSMISLVFAVDQASSALMRNTGIGRDAADAVFANTQELSRFGVSIEDQSKSFQSLFGNFTDFTFQNQEVRDSLVATTSKLAELGIAADDVSKGIQNSTKLFGQNAKAAEATAVELADFANKIGVAPSKIASDFASVGDSLAKLGSNGTRAFKELSVAAKITGIEVGRLMQITDKFDTFEGAAEQAGKLNAALGGNFVNAMDLLMSTDPIDRFQQIRDSISATGLTFDDMSYFQRKFFADAAGLNDVSELAKLMSGDFNDLAGAVNMSAADFAELDEKAKSVQSVQEELQAILQSLVPVLQPALESLRKFAEGLENNTVLIASLEKGISAAAFVITLMVENLHLLVGYLVLNAGIGIAKFSGEMLSGFETARTAVVDFADSARTRLTSFFSGSIEQTSDLTDTLGDMTPALDEVGESVEQTSESVSESLDNVGESAADNSRNLFALAAVVLALGVGFGLAAFGASFLVKSFGELTGDQIIGAVGGIVALGIALAIFAKVALAAAVPTGLAASAIFAIGAAVGVAAFGMSYLIDSFKGLGDQAGNILSASASLAALAGSVLLIGKFMTFAGPGFGLLILGMTGISAAMANMNSQPFADFTANLNTLIDNIDDLKKVKTEIVAISNAMEKIPAGSGMAIQTTTATAIMAGNMRRQQSIMFKPEQTFNLEVDGTQIRTVIKNIVGQEVEKRFQQE